MQRARRARRGAVAVASAVALAGALGTRADEAAPPGMARVPGGVYAPFQPVKGEAPRTVAPFFLDVRPVTNGEFLAFVRDEPRWRRSRVSRLFVDDAYLAPWPGDLELGPAAPPNAPVTYVSWFASDAYCRARGKRLPSEAEWELAAAPPEDGPEARAAADARVLAMSSSSQRPLPDVGSTPANAYGLVDLHGVVWEWVADFNASFAASDARRGGDRTLEEVCGGAAAAATDPSRYATFLRTAFRATLQASFSLARLGFRCARSAS